MEVEGELLWMVGLCHQRAFLYKLRGKWSEWSEDSDSYVKNIRSGATGGVTLEGALTGLAKPS